MDTVIAYADDVTILTSGKALEQVFMNAEAVHANVIAWADMNGLIINASKCAVMIISPSIRNICNDAVVRLGMAMLHTVQDLHIFGITFKFDLKWSAHALPVRSSVNKMIGVLNRFGNNLNTHACQRIMQAFIMLKIIYCMPIWGHIGKTDCA